MKRSISCFNHRIAMALLLGSAGLQSAAPVVAAPGDSLGTVTAPAPGCFGVGVAFDGTSILYTCNGSNAIFKTDLASNDLGVVTTADAGGNAVDLDAIAWDPNENVLWGGETNVGGTGDCGIWSVDLTTGLATLRFTFPSDAHEIAPGSNCNLSFFDGITVDTVTDTLYVSPDVHTFIHHVDKTGAPAANDNIPFESLTTGLCPWAAGFGYVGCLNSGLAIGVDGTLFAGTASDGQIMALDPTAPSLLSQFATVSGRDEDLECGPEFTKPDGSVVETILSRDLSQRIDVLEAPEGTCISPVRERPVPVDIKPTSCRNPLNTRSKGTLPVAILGTEDFDVTEVDPSTVQLEGVSPIRWNLEDVATPFEPFVGKEDAFDCTSEGPDGYYDLSLKFDTQEVVAALGPVADGDVLVLHLTANLLDGTPIVGEDVVVILAGH